ncbi:MAG: YezD family protein [Clostridiales Family XIII bacterium]|jgi:hypothetical protein|nr:YezD family protein [Clostridiales Family XIII bacterium]
MLQLQKAESSILPDEVTSVITEKDFKVLLSYIESIKYGSVTLKIQDGKAIQIEKNEKVKIR